MRSPSIRFSTLVIATTLAGAALAAPASAATGHRKHVKMHRAHVDRGVGYAQVSGWSGTAGRAVAASVCPGGIARSFECSKWPPPIEDDPDRVISGAAAD